MKRFVECEDRLQGVLLPEYLDDFVSAENPVRVIDVFVDELDLLALGFAGVVPERTGRPGYHLTEQQLSSGEYHFLYMMVSALTCKRVGTIIAIDEPELSLHVTWQRKLVQALADCAEGASPILLFATHSSAISAQHQECLVRLSEVD